MVIDPTNPLPGLFAFVRSWAGPRRPEYGIGGADIPGFVPRPLRELYEFAGRWPALSDPEQRDLRLLRGMDNLRLPDELEVRGDRLVFLDECQNVWRCETLTYADDPPVFSDSDRPDGQNVGMRQVCDRLSVFLVAFCLHELVFGAPVLFAASSGSGKRRPVDELTRAPIRALWPDAYYAFGERTHSFFIAGDRLLIMDPAARMEDKNYWIAMKDEAALSLLADGVSLNRVI